MEALVADNIEQAPLGVVTFLATDVVASTQIWRRAERENADRAMARHREILVDAVHRHGGYFPPDQGEGDSTFTAFRRPAEALAAALDAQRALAEEPWPEDAEIRVRMAVHTGDVEPAGDGNYRGLAVIRCARLRSHAHGGQILASAATAETVADALPDGVRLADLGTVALDGFEQPVRVHQLIHPDLPAVTQRLGALAARAIPRWSTPLVGRDVDRDDVAARVRESRLVTISGVGGVGKTRLAAAVAEQLGEEFEDGVAWTELARLSSPDQVAGAVAALCGVVDSGAPILDRLASNLDEASLLIVLDNCEHVIDGCAELAEALLRRAGPGVHVLATSRESLAVTGETVWRTPSLAVPSETEHDAERINACGSVRLFLDRGRRSGTDLESDDAGLREVARICRRLDGIPLALELAAARLGSLSLSALAERLDERFRLLTGGSRRSVERQRTLLASVAWSYDLLEPDERLLFRRLSIFASPFTLDLAEAVGSGAGVDPLGVFDLLARLVDKSLVQRVGDRYRLLETLRQYGLERAHDEDEIDDLRGRHLAAYRRRVARWELDTRVMTREVLDEVIAECPDLIAALDWSLAIGSPAVELLEPLGEMWAYTTRIDEVRAVMPRVLEALEPGSPIWLEALGHTISALFLAGVREWLPQVVSIVREDLPLRLRVALNYGALMSRVGGILSTERNLHESLEELREAGFEKEVIDTTVNLALVRAQAGKIVDARRTLAWLDLHVPGDAARRQHELARMLALNLSGKPFESVPILESLAAARVHRVGVFGQMAATGLWARDAHLVARARSPRDDGLFTGAFAGFAALTTGAEALLGNDLERAWSALREGIGESAVGADLYCNLHGADVALALGEDEEAERAVAEGLALLDGAEAPFQIAWAHLVRSALAARAGNPGLARQLAHDALDLALEHGIGLIETDALESLAVFAAEDGELEQAARLLGACEAFRARGGYRWRPHHRERALCAVRDDLPAAAVDEGSGMSLDDAAEYARRGRGERSRPTHGWDSLTPAELGVVELVAEGLANRDIASRLFVSTATVKTHLVHVYRKLELGSRAQLAAEATSRRIQSPSRTSPSE